MGLNIKTEGKFEILIEGDNYRVTSITRFLDALLDADENNLYFKNLDASKGLNIEEKMPDNNYMVLNTFYWDKKREDVCIEDVCCRSIDTLKYKEKNIKDYFKRIQEYVNCLDFARKALIDIHNKEKENDGYFVTSESSNTRIFCYRGFEVELKIDEDGQQVYFEFDGKEYSCGAFNPYPEEEIKWVIDEYLEEGN